MNTIKKITPYDLYFHNFVEWLVSMRLRSFATDVICFFVHYLVVKLKLHKSYTKFYIKIYTRVYTKNYTRVYTKNYTRVYTRNYTRVYTKTYTRVYSKNYTRV